MPGFSSKRKTFIFDLLIISTVFCLMLAFLTYDTVQMFNWKLFDTLMHIRRQTTVKSENVAIVCIDQRSLEYYLENGVSWPWPREFYSRLTNYLSGCGARAIIYDIIFSDPDFERSGEGGKIADVDFGDAIRESDRTYLVVQAYPDSIPENPHSESFYLTNDTIYKKYDAYSTQYAVFPLEVLSAGAKGLGLANVDPPEVDGIYRRYPLVRKIHNRYVPSLAYSVARDILGEENIRERLFDSSGKSRYVDKNGMLLLNWYGESGPTDGVFTYYSFHGVIDSAISAEQDKPLLIPKEAFKDKIVIVGSNAPGLLDLKPTPFSTQETPYPGMEIHATAIENFLNDDFIYRVPLWIVALCMMCAILVIFIGFKYLTQLKFFIAVFVACIIAELLTAFGVLSGNNVMPWVEILGATTLSFVGLVLSGYFRESKDKKILRRSFERYVNDSVLEDILENPNSVDFEGRVLTATIMATDIAGFTSISEKLSAHDVVSRLNDYLSEVSEIIIDHGGYINKYIGDAILAVFGAFGENEHHKRACIAGVNAMKIIERKISEAKINNLDPFVTRMGITTGDLTMGNIGSARKIEYTVIGDSVNSAFRLEGLNKYYNTRLLVSEYTRAGAGDDFEFRLIDLVKVKGKETPVGIYELLGMKDDVSPVKLRNRDEFEDAVNYYREGNFERALEKFSRLTDAGDPPSPVMKERCEYFLKNPPGNDWAGVWTMTSK
ncbi:MAG: adenylate/guanylate cyclase domain-containing protein [Candidatus Latescibacteria bacterium]|nr:adenylate/guanylate cyclase domain-containing protein [Candidatus Latescibacterota bacterium]